MLKRYVIALLSFLSLSGLLCAKQFNFPLQYKPDYGIYTAILSLSDNKNPIEFIVDTGSANFLVRGDRAICKQCHSFITDKPLAVNKEKLSDKAEHVRYGSARMTFRIYQDKLWLKDESPFCFQFAVATSGEHISNIWGLAYQVLAMPHNNPLPTLFNAMRNKLNFVDQFKLLLCGDKGKSYLSFSTTHQPLNTKLVTPIVDNFFYNAQLTGIKSGEDRIIQFKPGYYQSALLDSGTGGLIVLPRIDRNSILNYVFRHTSKQNQLLPKPFWEKNACLLKKDIDFSRLPTLQFGFVDANNPKQSMYLNLPPEAYVNAGGCPQGSARLVFVENAMISHHYKKHPHKQLLFHRLPDVIIGTPIFEQYEVIFDRGEPAKIGFVPSKELCRP